VADEKDKKATEAKPKDAAKPAAKKPAAKAEATDAKAAKPAAKKPAEKKAATAKPKPADKKPAAKAEKADTEKTEAKSKSTAAKSKPEEGAKKPAAKKPAPTRRKPAVDPTGEPVLVRATAKYVRTSPRKSRLVVDHIRGKKVEEARVTLKFMARHVARDVAKVLESAVANAEHNHELDPDDLNVVIAYVDEGPTFKRWKPRARGRATQILKRTSHITVVVSNSTAKEVSSRKAVA
jgi:ribosomal protein L22